jgi:hypothetical protein
MIHKAAADEIETCIHNHLATVNKQAAKYRYFEELLSHQIYGGYTKH